LIAKMSGYREVYDTLEQETGVRFGETDEAGMFGLWSPTSTRGAGVLPW
jgi:[NiFe] hydrogenase diaphorase moiety large subunit